MDIFPLSLNQEEPIFSGRIYHTVLDWFTAAAAGA